jgi:hypothetical protein
MAQTKRLEKVIDDFTDDLLYSRFLELGRELAGEAGIEKARDLLGRIKKDPRPVIRWDELTPEEQDLLEPVGALAHAADVFNSLPIQRKDKLLKDIRYTLYGGSRP